MIAELKPYPNRKDSGVEWLGEVPEHWEVRREKTICDPIRPNTGPEYYARAIRFPANSGFIEIAG